jgi:drug/metabolite transporter (DMT)-like permease
VFIVASVVLNARPKRWFVPVVTQHRNRLLAGCAVAFTGVALIGVGVSKHGLEATWGAALCLIAALAYAAGVVAQKPALRHAPALTITWLACTVGAGACLPYAPSLVRQLGQAHAGAIGWTIYLGLGPTAVGFVTWAYALARTDAGRLGVTTYLVPPQQGVTAGASPTAPAAAPATDASAATASTVSTTP